MPEVPVAAPVELATWARGLAVSGAARRGMPQESGERGRSVSAGARADRRLQSDKEEQHSRGCNERYSLHLLERLMRPRSSPKA